MLSGIVLFFWFGIYILVEARTSKTVVYYGLITVYRPLRKIFSFTFSDVVSAKLNSKKLYYGTDERIVVITKSGMKMIIGKIKGYQGHHMKSAKGYPQLASDPTNIL